MLDQIEKLLVLQDRDQRLAAITQQRKLLPTERAHVERQKAGAEASLDFLRSQLRENEVARKSLEIEAQTKRDAIAKYKHQQLATRKNEEFSALGNEIQRAEQDIRSIEDRELDLMEAAETLRRQLKDADAAIASTRAELAERASALAAKESALDAQQKEVETERAALAASVDEEFLEIYERIMRKKHDSALAPLAHGICGGCHMRVSASTGIGVKNASELVTCDQCGRILYAAE